MCKSHFSIHCSPEHDVADLPFRPIFAAMNIAMLRGWWRYYRSAKTIYKVQSPRMYDFLCEIMDTSTRYYRWADIERERYRLLRDDTVLEVVDYGAGSQVLGGLSRSIRRIAKTSVSPSAQCQQLYRAVRAIKPTTILEMGASLGVSTAYLAAAAPKAHCLSLEGDLGVAAYARRTAAAVGLDRVEVRVGPFVDTLPRALDDLGVVDIAFVDGHHDYAATLAYTQAILPFMTTRSVLIYDDIYWSLGMQQAWHELQALPQVTMSLDTFYQGYLFFDPDIQQPQHYTYISQWAKPWQVGLFQ